MSDSLEHQHGYVEANNKSQDLENDVMGASPFIHFTIVHEKVRFTLHPGQIFHHCTLHGNRDH